MFARFCLAASVVLAGTAQAQELGDEEILRRFDHQASVWGEIDEDGYVKTRSASLPRGVTMVVPAEEAGTSTPVIVYEEPVDIRIEFEFDSARILPEQRTSLDQMCRIMQARDYGFRVIGHTDGLGEETYNDVLSARRAEEVRKHLVEACGIAPERLQAMGLGEEYPLQDASPNAPENRRVEFQATG